MKHIIKRGCFLTLMFMLLGCLSLYAADNDLITKQITINLEKAGTLPDRIASSKKYKITNLKIIGEINGTDLRMIREMAGRNSSGDYTDGKLSVLEDTNNPCGFVFISILILPEFITDSIKWYRKRIASGLASKASMFILLRFGNLDWRTSISPMISPPVPQQKSRMFTSSKV